MKIVEYIHAVWHVHVKTQYKENASKQNFYVEAESIDEALKISNEKLKEIQKQFSEAYIYFVNAKQSLKLLKKK